MGVVFIELHKRKERKERKKRKKNRLPPRTQNIEILTYLVASTHIKKYGLVLQRSTALFLLIAIVADMVNNLNNQNKNKARVNNQITRYSTHTYE